MAKHVFVAGETVTAALINVLTTDAAVTQVTATVGSITNAADVVLVTSPTVTGDGVKRFKITASTYTLAGTVAADIFTLKIKADGAVIRSGLATITANGTSDAKVLSITHVPAAGSHTYTFTAIRGTGTGTGSIAATATDPIEIVVEQISA